jgi:hypothetical protein
VTPDSPTDWALAAVTVGADSVASQIGTCPAASEANCRVSVSPVLQPDPVVAGVGESPVVTALVPSLSTMETVPIGTAP